MATADDDTPKVRTGPSERTDARARAEVVKAVGLLQIGSPAVLAKGEFYGLARDYLGAVTSRLASEIIAGRRTGLQAELASMAAVIVEATGYQANLIKEVESLVALIAEMFGPEG